MSRYCECLDWKKESKDFAVDQWSINLEITVTGIWWACEIKVVQSFPQSIGPSVEFLGGQSRKAELPNPFN